METRAQHRVRIVTALEDLVAQESAALGNRDFAGLLGLQERTGPLVEFLVAGAAACTGEPELRRRIEEVRRRREEHAMALAGDINRLRAQLQQLEATRRRVAQVAPVYSEAVAPTGNWTAVG